MTKRKSYKLLLTELVLGEIPRDNNIYIEIPIDNLLFRWWFTGRQDGLRLTKDGDNAFRLAKLENYEIPLLSAKEIPDYEFMLELSKKIKCPYFLGVNKNKETNKIQPFIRLYDSKIVMMINLYGNLREYLNSVRIR